MGRGLILKEVSSKKKRPVPTILVISSKYPPEYAGSGLRAHRTYKRLGCKFGFEYRVVCGSVVFNDTKDYQFEGVPVYRIACKLFRDIKDGDRGYTRKIKNGINYIAEAILTWAFLFRYGRSFDLIHVFGSNYVTAAALSYAKIMKKPLILEVCNEVKRLGQYEPLPLKVIFGKGLPPYAKLVCISKRIRDACVESGCNNAIWSRPNPVDSLRFFDDRERKAVYRKRHGFFNDNDIVLLNIGKICPLKNQIFLIDILKGMPQQYKLVIAGPVVNSGPDFKRDTAYLDEIKRNIEALRLAGRVKVINRFIDNIDEYIKAADIYLLPSRVEACATPVLEALACGVPVVAHHIEGVTTEWIREGINGYLAPLDADDFRRKIEMAAALDRDGLTKGAKEIMDEVSSDIIDKRYRDLIMEALKG